MGIVNFHSHYAGCRNPHNKQMLHILLDGGSMHDFLDLEVAKKLGCKLEKAAPIFVTAGGGTKLEAPLICKNFSWSLQQSTFSANVFVLPLSTCDLIWVSNPMAHLFESHPLGFFQVTHDNKFVLRGAKARLLISDAPIPQNATADSGMTAIANQYQGCHQ